MNALRALYAIGLWVVASVAIAAPITYNFSATDFNSSFTNTSGPNSSISGSIELDDDLLLGIDLEINGHVYSTDEVEYYKDSWMLGASLCAFNCMNAFTNDFLLEFDVTTLTFWSFTYTAPGFNDIWYSSTGSIAVANVEVPEPSGFLLMILAVFGLVVRSFKARH